MLRYINRIFKLVKKGIFLTNLNQYSQKIIINTKLCINIYIQPKKTKFYDLFYDLYKLFLKFIPIYIYKYI